MRDIKINKINIKIGNMVNKTERLEYLDALRGFAMLLVVFVHVEIFGFFEFSHTTFLGKLFSAIHLPTFFFISGFCIYRPNAVYGVSHLYKDILRLILPAFIVGIIYTYLVIHQDVLYFLSNTMKAGYWFTISLFEILLIYRIVYCISKNRDRVFVALLVLLAVFLYLIKLPLKVIPQAELIGNYLCLHQTCNYFLYFVIGILCSKYKGLVTRYLSNKLISSFVLLVFGVISYLMFSYFSLVELSGVTGKIIETLGETLIGMSGVLLLYMLFFHNKSIFNNGNLLGKSLIIIGNNTLAIYLLHYFLLPNLPMVGDFFKNYPNILCELILGLIISYIVIIVSIIVARLIRISPIIGRALLGDK